MVAFEKLKEIVMRALWKGRAEGIYVGDLAYRLSYRGGYALKQVPGYSRNSAGAWTWKKATGRLHIRLDAEPNPHVLIVGSSGYGKSTLLKAMLHEMGSMHIPVVVFDGHNEHGGAVRALGGNVYDASRQGINIFALDGMQLNERIDSISRLLKNVYGLGYLQESTLRQCMSYMYRKHFNRISGRLDSVPSMNDLVREIDIFISKSNSAAEMNRLKQIRGRISLLGSGSFSGSISIDALMHGISSFSLSDMRSEESMAIYMHELLKRLYMGMKGNEKEKGIRTIMMIDEADALLDRHSPSSGIIGKLISEGRKYGIGVIIAAHNASRLESGIASNLSTVIAFRPRDPPDINYISNMMAYGNPGKADAVREMLGRLGQHSAMLVNYKVSRPVVFSRRMDQRAPHEPAYDGAAANNFIVSSAGRPMKLEALKERIATIYGELGLKDLDRLLSMGALKVFKSDDGTWVGTRANPGLEHEVMLLRIYEKLRGIGATPYILDSANRPDIAVNISGKRLAIEYETGSKGSADTAGMLERRLAEYDAVLVVTNEQNIERYSIIARGIGNRIKACLYRDISASLMESLFDDGK